MNLQSNTLSNQNLSELTDFFESRYNFNTIPYINYPQRITNILYGNNKLNDSSVFEAEYNNLLHGRINGQWKSFNVIDSYSKEEADGKYYSLNANPNNYLISETDPIFNASPSFNILTTDINNWNSSYSWGDHSIVGYALSSNLHAVVTLSITNGLSLVGQQLSLALATISTPGAMSGADKTKLNDIVVHDPTSLGIPNGLSLSGQVISLNLATGSTSGAMSALDKNKLDTLQIFADHDQVTLSTANGLSLNNQILSLNIATISNAGAMSAIDKSKLDSLQVGTFHDPISISLANGLSLVGQSLSLSLATISASGSMSNTDKIKLNSLTNYTHPIGFTNKPTVALNNNIVISQIEVSAEGHVTDVVTRSLTASNIGITPSSLVVVNNTNLELVLTGTPLTSLLEDVTITSNWVGVLSVDKGGTGVGTFTTGELLVGNGTGVFSTINRLGIDTRSSFPASTHNLTSHSDVNISVPTTNQVLAYNGTSWINSTLDISGITFTETDPIFVGFRDTVRTANTIYAAPNGSDGIGVFRSLTIGDIPNAYVRFDISQSLTEVQKQRVRTSIGVQVSGAYELAFSKGNAITSTGTVLSITNGTSRVIGISDLIIDHAVSGWVDKTALTGAFIISDLVVDSFGHIADWTTRELTLADLGYVGFDPAVMQTTLDDHETRISVLEGEFPLLNGDKNYIHTQSSPAAIWNYTHGLGKKPSVTIIDSAGSIILAKLTYVDLNTIQIDFNGSATSGEAINN